MPSQVTPGLRSRIGASVMVIDSAGRILLQLRDKHLAPDRYPDQWSVPGGMMKPGEFPVDAALREFAEETGHRLGRIVPFDVFCRNSNMPTLAVAEAYVFYTYEAVPEASIVVNEGQAFRYHGPEELDALTMPPPWRAIVSRFFDSPHYTFGGQHD
ncbi:hypothetical protein LCGC14_1834600 [marine sediment metagenome]|uniref:Nudix hydrolase domain-containing protein n=1 Tax=marine sediment metagenome TaxID=412755 RepID=A0A0F9JEK2_9ZZZZ